MEITSRGFTVSGVAVARSPLARLRGLIGHEPYPLLMATSSVHGFGLRQPVWAVAIAADGTVVSVRRLRRRRVLWERRAKWTLELPIDSPTPVSGETLAFCPPWHQAERDGRPSV